MTHPAIQSAAVLRIQRRIGGGFLHLALAGVSKGRCHEFEKGIHYWGDWFYRECCNGGVAAERASSQRIIASWIGE